MSQPIAFVPASDSQTNNIQQNFSNMSQVAVQYPSDAALMRQAMVHFSQPTSGQTNDFPTPVSSGSPSIALKQTSRLAQNAAFSFSQPLGLLAGAAVNGLFNLGSTIVRSNAQRDIAKMQYDLVQQDYAAAKQMGLMHPSQISQVSGGGGIYKMSARGLSRVPIAQKGSPYTI